MPRSQRSFCAGVPCLVRMLPTIAGETTISSSEQPAAAISSPTHESAAIPRPPPSYSSGMLTPRYPREAERVPQLARRLAGVALALHVLAAEAAADAGDRLAQQGLLLRGHQRQGGGGGSG